MIDHATDGDDAGLARRGKFRPVGIAAASGTAYVTDDRGRVFEVARGSAGARDCRVAARLSRRRRRRRTVSPPQRNRDRGPGRLIVADAGNALVRLVAAQSQLEFRLPPSPLLDPRFDVAAFAAEPLLWPVAPMEGHTRSPARWAKRAAARTRRTLSRRHRCAHGRGHAGAAPCAMAW